MRISGTGACSHSFGFVVILLHIITKACGMDGDTTDPASEFLEPIEFPDSLRSSSEPLESLQSSNEVQRLQPSPPKYSAFVVFGDSYSDNGHPRSPENQHSLAAKPAAGGRYCDGPVWDEYLAQRLSNSEDSTITFLNYAYNGAQIDNRLSNASYPVPDTAYQIQTYLTELEKYVQHPISGQVFGGKILHTLWIGINPILLMWKSTSYGNQTLHPGTFLTQELVAKLDAQVAALSKQLALLLGNPSLSKSAPSPYFFTANLPPTAQPVLFDMMLAITQASEEAKGDVTLARKYIRLLAQLTDYFNKKLFEAIETIRRQQKMAHAAQKTTHRSMHQSRVTLFDTVAFWNDVRSNPQEFGIRSFGSCYEGTSKPPCQKPDHFMYWDALHPSSIFHNDLSAAIEKFLDNLDE